MEIKNIIKKLHKNSITNYEIIPMQSGCDTVRIPYRTGYELTNITELFKRGVKIDIDSYTKTVTLWNFKEWERSRQLYDKVTILVELFYAELRNGKTPEEAKKTQLEYAKANNMLAVFYMIYK
jgi:hypothetical protein